MSGARAFKRALLEAAVRGVTRALMDAWPNAELTGRRRMDALPARRRIGKERLAGKVASRWRSG